MKLIYQFLFIVVFYSQIMSITTSHELRHSPAARDTKLSSRVIVIIRSLMNTTIFLFHYLTIISVTPFFSILHIWKSFDFYFPSLYLADFIDFLCSLLFSFSFYISFLIFLLVCPFAQDIYFTSDPKTPKPHYHESSDSFQIFLLFTIQFILRFSLFFVVTLSFRIFFSSHYFLFLSRHNFLYHLFSSKETVMLSPFVFNLSLC
jgi:hypothetical protein